MNNKKLDPIYHNYHHFSDKYHVRSRKTSKDRCKKKHFHVGFLYHEGKYVDQDIEKAIHYYKEGSSFNDQHAKNNLGIIYKNGFHGKIQPRIGLAIEYFEESIRQENQSEHRQIYRNAGQIIQ